MLPNGELLVGTGSGEVITVEMGDVKKSSPGLTFDHNIDFHIFL